MVAEKYGKFTAPIVMIGFGGIAHGLLPLLKRHFHFPGIIAIEPRAEVGEFLKKHGVRHIQKKVTKQNYRDLLRSVLKPGGFCVNLSVDVSSLDVMKMCQEIGAPYIDTVVEPWAGFYFDKTLPDEARTNYALRKQVRDYQAKSKGKATCVSCCGANPGMVSWFVKETLLTLAKDTGIKADPKSREDWAALMKRLDVWGIHIAERDTQTGGKPKPMGVFVNTWSVDGFLSEGFQPAELGWGSKETWKPEGAHELGNILWLDKPGALTRVHSWCPTPGAQFGLLVTHNEAVSISDYFSTNDYRPTCHYAYHPCDDAMLSLDEMFGAVRVQETGHLLNETEIIDGRDELGVLLFGHAKNALWYGSRLTMAEARRLAPYQNATALQVTSAVLAGMAWAVANPDAGIVETEEMDHAFCLKVQRPYLGSVEAIYTDWTPIKREWAVVDEEIDKKHPWSFKNVLATS